MFGKTPSSKSQKILKYLQTHSKGITQAQAVDKFKAYRLSSIIFNLKKAGYNIETEYVQVKNKDGSHTRYARYYLVDRE